MSLKKDSFSDRRYSEFSMCNDSFVSATWISRWADNFIDFPEAFRSRRRLVASKKHHRGIEFRANTSAPLINLN